ncbi:MAG TPA: AAA family ATPase [Candidatus Aphodomonas merdavium]|nr:AAA family ATPase [Candidatus Aphodomonas merdavium]
MEKRLQEVLQLQEEYIQSMAKMNMRGVYDDFWGAPGAKAAKGQADAPAKSAPQAGGEEQPTERLEDLLKELDGYIGLASVKEQVRGLVNWIAVNRMRARNGLPQAELSLHMIFSGNPGTGKTMIARLMARILKSIGILQKGVLVEVDRGGLVAGYVGQTAAKTDAAIRSALGGVLFIDEAYALVSRGENDFGQEAIETLLKQMEDHRDELVVIAAGYPRQMEAFLHANPGLESRFTRFWHFPDYSIEELLAIFEIRCTSSGYCLAPAARPKLGGVLAARVREDCEGFGNARGVRNLFEETAARQANRLAALPPEKITKEALMCLTEDDLPPL